MQDENQIDLIFDDLKNELEKTVAYLKSEYAIIRAGRANPHILDKVIVDYYGAPTPVNQMANLTVADARMLVVNLYDATQLKNVLKTIQEADLGVNVSDDGRAIRLVFPVLTEERRKELSKNLKVILENAKVAMRNARRDCIDMFKQMKKDGEISEDSLSSYEKEVQKVLDGYVANLDSIYAAKEKEVMEI